MSESLIRRRFLPLAAIGASTLALTGCVVANIAETSSLVFGCPPKAPSPKISRAHYTSLPGDKGKVEVDFSCVNKNTGAEAAPLRIDLSSRPFNASMTGEREYTFDVGYGVNIEGSDPKPVVSKDPAQPSVATVKLRGDIVNFEGVTSPTLASLVN